MNKIFYFLVKIPIKKWKFKIFKKEIKIIFKKKFNN